MPEIAKLTIGNLFLTFPASCSIFFAVTSAKSFGKFLVPTCKITGDGGWSIVI